MNFNNFKVSIIKVSIIFDQQHQEKDKKDHLHKI